MTELQRAESWLTVALVTQGWKWADNHIPYPTEWREWYIDGLNAIAKLIDNDGGTNGHHHSNSNGKENDTASV